MSVNVCDRKMGRLETLTKAMELASHTIRVCDNEKVFQKRHRLSVTADIIKETKWLPKLINRANKKDLFKETKERKKLQKQALDLLDDIEIDLQITYLALSPNISEQKLDYLVGLVTETRTKLNAWIKADNEEIKKINQPIHFLGFSYKLKDSGKIAMRVLPKNISKNRRKLKKLVIIKSVNRFECNKVLQAILAHIRKSNNRSQVNKLIKYYNELWKEKDYVESKIIRGKSCRFRETC